MDEAASSLRMAIDSKPEELDNLDRRIMQLKIEREALKKEHDEQSKKRLEEIEKETADLEEKARSLNDKWKAEKQSLADLTDVKDKLDKAKIEAAIAQRNGQFEKAGELQYGVIPDLEKKMQALEDLAKERKGRAEKVVTDESIAEVVSKWTGVPVDKMLEGEKKNCCGWKIIWAGGWSDKKTRFVRLPTPYAAHVPESAIIGSRSVRFCFWARPGSEKPN